MIQLNPRIIRSQSVVELPRPIVVLRIQDSWDVVKLKVPLLDGDNVTGHSRTGVDITVEGQLGTHIGQKLVTEQDMLQALEALREALHVSDDEDRYQLSLFQNENLSTHRYFQKCSTLRFDYDFSNKHLYTYVATIHASDPNFYDATE